MKYWSNSILALIHPNEEEKTVLKQALYFQKALKMRIFILNIIKSSRVFQTKKGEIHRNAAIKKLDHLVKNEIQKDIPNEIIIRVKAGKIVPTLIKESKKGGYGFIIIDKSEKKDNGLSKNEIDKIISKSHCPILTINKNFPTTKVTKIVIPIDISQSTKKRLYWATFFAKKFNAKIIIVSALNINIDETKSLAFRNGEKIKKMLIKRGVDCDVKLLKVKTKKEYKIILDFIDEENPELVIIRKHQKHMFSGKKIGNFVSEIIHGCKIPVFSVGQYKQTFPKDLF